MCQRCVHVDCSCAPLIPYTRHSSCFSSLGRRNWLLPPVLLHISLLYSEGTKGGWAGRCGRSYFQLTWLVRAETLARRRSDGRAATYGFSQSRDSNRCRSARQTFKETMPAGDIFGRYVYLPISSRIPGDGHVRTSLHLCCVSDVPSFVFSPSASETLSCWRPQSADAQCLSVTHPPLPCASSGEGFLLRSRACVRGAPLSSLRTYSLHTYISYPFYQRMSCV